MPTDIKAIIENLTSFYSFEGRAVISVGAGGGQLIEYGRKAKQVVALDSDPHALETLQQQIQVSKLEQVYLPVLTDFFAFIGKADVVLFEFSLHEISTPEKALQHALCLAPEVVIIDHFPDSPWAYVVSEEVKVENSWRAIRRFPLRVEKKIDAWQVFRGYDELYQRVKGQGEITLQRIERYKYCKDFTIPMSYGLARVRYQDEF